MPLRKKQFAFYITTLLFLFSANSYAQNTEKWGIGVHTFGGFVWAHTPEVSNLKAHIYGSSLDFRFKTANRKAWHKEYNQPMWGIRLYYAYLGNPNIAGSAFAILPYIDLPVIRKYSWKWSLRGTAGLGYITQPFSLDNNVVNRTVASRLNTNMSFHGVISKFLNKNLELTLVGGITHFSNGNYKQPNLGINLPDASLGLTYYVGKKQVTSTENEAFDSTDKEWAFSLLVGSKSTSYIFPNQVTPFAFQSKYIQNISSKSKLGGGIDLFYDEGNLYAVNSPNKVKEGIANALELGAKVSYELKINRLSVISNVGVYLYNTNTVKKRFYQQVGFRWRASQKISFYSILKAHFDSADFIGVGIGYTINKI